MQQLLKVLALTIFIGILQACATTSKIDLLAEGEVKVSTVPSELISFTKIDVHQHDDTTQIEVVVHPIKPVKRFLSGEVLITTTDPNGHQQTILIDKAHKDHYSTGHKTQHSHFTTFLPYKLPPGTTIRIEHKPSIQK